MIWRGPGKCVHPAGISPSRHNWHSLHLLHRISTGAHCILSRPSTPFSPRSLSLSRCGYENLAPSFLFHLLLLLNLPRRSTTTWMSLTVLAPPPHQVLPPTSSLLSPPPGSTPHGTSESGTPPPTPGSAPPAVFSDVHQQQQLQHQLQAGGKGAGLAALAVALSGAVLLSSRFSSSFQCALGFLAFRSVGTCYVPPKM